MTPPPSSDFQLRFLRDLQGILEEGQFTATYKYALLHALADLAVVRGDDSGSALRVPLRLLAERFVELYWRQVSPWPAGDRSAVLAQNTGKQAAIVQKVKEASAAWGHRLDRMRRREDDWDGIVREVDRVIRVMPLWRLQMVGGQVRPFLYDHELDGRGAGAALLLKPGVAYCFRIFHPLVIDLVRGSWTRFIRRLNPGLLGEQAELREFLFGAPRLAVSKLCAPLLELQDGTCFYCRGTVRDRPQVDHFIPWSRYPADLGHNLVVTHERCNAEKSDHLAALSHLERWAERNDTHRYALPRVMEEVGMRHELEASLRIAEWAYGQVAERGGATWVEGKRFEVLGAGWEGVLGGASSPW